MDDCLQVVDRRLDPLRGELLSAVERVAREAAAAQAAARSLEARLGEAAAAGSTGRGLGREVLDGRWQSGGEAEGRPSGSGRVEELGRRVEAVEERLVELGAGGGGGGGGAAGALGPGAAAGAAALRERVEVLGKQQVGAGVHG